MDSFLLGLAGSIVGGLMFIAGSWSIFLYQRSVANKAAQDFLSNLKSYAYDKAADRAVGKMN